MFRLFRQFIALLLAIWLPLFSGNALAMSVVMQVNGSCCPAGIAQSEQVHHMGPSSEHAQHGHHVAPHDPAAAGCEQHDGQHVQQGSSCDRCGTCHLASSGYLAAAAIEVVAAQPTAQPFCTLSTRFQSAIPTLLDPPPLLRA